MNAALYRPCASNAPPQSAFGSYMYDRGPNWKGSRYHLGKDTPLAQGTPLYASGTGVVVRVTNFNAVGYIWIVAIEYAVPGGVARVEAHHMSRIDVSVGQQVSLNTRIGLSGGKPGTLGAGNSTGPHLHTQTYFNGNLVDPDSILNSRSQIAGGGTDPFGEDMPLDANDKDWLRIMVRQEIAAALTVPDAGYGYLPAIVNQINGLNTIVDDIPNKAELGQALTSTVALVNDHADDNKDAIIAAMPTGGVGGGSASYDLSLTIDEIPGIATGTATSN